MSRATPRFAIIQLATGESMPPESRETARPLMPTGRPPAPGCVGVYECTFPHLDIDREIRVVDVHLQVVVGLVELTPHILADLDGGHGEGFIGPLGLHLEGAGGAELVIQKFLGAGQNGVLVLVAGTGQRDAHNAEHLGEGLVGAFHIAGIVLGLHIGGGLAGVHPELSVGVEAAVDVRLEFILKAAGWFRPLMPAPPA